MTESPPLEVSQDFSQLDGLQAHERGSRRAAYRLHSRLRRILCLKEEQVQRPSALVCRKGCRDDPGSVPHLRHDVCLHMVPASPHTLRDSALLNHDREHQIPLGLPAMTLPLVPPPRVRFERTTLYWSYEYSTE